MHARHIARRRRESTASSRRCRSTRSVPSALARLPAGLPVRSSHSSSPSPCLSIVIQYPNISNGPK
jgi:hypothetical protein